MRTTTSTTFAYEPPQSEADSVVSQGFQPFIIQPVTKRKRAFDICVLILSLPVILPVWLICAATIKLVSRGPLFFVQERVGHNGVPFNCYKFRTMRTGADTAFHQNYFRQLQQDDVPMQKLDAADPRIIPCGKIIRALGLDELPQLINVLKGEMSLVGPRPCTPFELQRYAPHQRERFSALPGLTGLWQVSGKNRTTFARMIELDIEYVRSQSAIQDVKILALTPITLAMQFVEAIASRRGASANLQSPAAVQVQGATDV
jgi:lipopolysaccharide/colanic/teichoic acid biosynthesis glycosyltransferase